MTQTTIDNKAGVFINKSSYSAWIISIVTVVALLLGWGLKTAVENKSQVVEHNGIRASIPENWAVDKGLLIEEKVCSASDPLSAFPVYTVKLLPSSEAVTLSDIAFNLNLERGQQLISYSVLEQNLVRFAGQEVYRLHFAYVKANEQNEKPIVVEGLDYIFPTLPKALVVTLEDDSRQYQDALPRFKNFVKNVSYTAGGE